MSDRRAAALRTVAVFAAALALNLATAAPTVVEGDGAELQTVAALGGVAHPTGYPTWTLCGRLFHRVWPGEPARRTTALSAVAGAAAAALLARVLGLLGAAPGAAAAGALLLAAGVTFRWASIYPEVYALAVLLALIAVERVLHALRRPGPGARLVAAAALSLAVTGHFLMIPVAAVLGLILLSRGGGGGRAVAGRAATLAGGALLGLLPYLYTAWADAAGLPMNYLRLVVDAEAGMFGLTPERFDSAWERVGWLVFGAETRLFPYYQHPRLLAINAGDGLAQQLLFEAGPAALVLAPLGAQALGQRHRGACAAVLAVIVTSFGFAVTLVDGRMLLPFMLPATAGLALLGGIGAARLADGTGAGPRLAGTLAVVIAGVAAALPHAIRVGAAAHPIGPRGWQHRVEGGPPVAGLLPRLDRAHASRRTAERALELIPPDALVIGRWRELMTLYYLRDVEGRRRDLTFDPVYRGHERRYARWQARHDLGERPFVLLGRSREVEAYLGRRDSLEVTPELRLYVQREPMRGLPGP